MLKIVNKLIYIIMKKPNSKFIYLLPFLLLLKGSSEIRNSFKKALILINEHKPIVIMSISSVKNLNILNENYFFKIGLDENAIANIKNEYNNWKKYKKDNQLAELLIDDMSLHNKHGIFYLKMRRMDVIQNNGETIKAVNEILCKLKKMGAKKKFRITADMLRGLEYIKRFYSKKFTEYLKNVLYSNSNKYVYIGPAHGDFHSRNVLKMPSQENLSEKTYILVDLERFALQGIQFLDCVHFIVDFESRKHGVSWFEQLLYFNENSWQVEKPLHSLFSSFVDLDLNDLTYIYLFDRVGKEVVNSKKTPVRWRKKLKETIEVLSLNYENKNSLR